MSKAAERTEPEKIDSGGSPLNLISFSSFIFARLMAVNLLVASLSSAFAFSDQTKKRDRGKPLTASSGRKREKGRRESPRFARRLF